jgi:hypothetical protein
MSPWCSICDHDLAEHDGMGDCVHEDGRTATGFCNRHSNQPSDTSLSAWTVWSQKDSNRHGEPVREPFRAGHRAGVAPARRRRHNASPDETPAEAAYIRWAAESVNTRYGTLGADAFAAGFETGATER